MGNDQKEHQEKPQVIESFESTMASVDQDPEQGVNQGTEEGAEPSILSRAFPNLDKSLLGSTFAERYRILEPLGSGGMSVVYRAKHLTMNRDVAIKILHSNRATDEVSLRRFKQEALATSSLSHPNIVAVHDFGATGEGTTYLVMDLVVGKPLSQILKTEGALSLERFLNLMQQVASALAHAHDKGIVHRDLKPSNIMICQVDGNEQAQIVDFGIAKVLGPEEAGQLTQTGEVFGSPFYMSPEQCSGGNIDARSDIYSFGCVMYECLCGQVPFAGESVFDTIHKHLNDAPPPVAAPGIPEEIRSSLELLILKSLAKSRDDRPQKMTEIYAQLRALSLKSGFGLFEKMNKAYQLATVKSKASRKNLTPTILITLALVSFVSFGSLVTLYIRGEDDKKQLNHSRIITKELSLIQIGFLRFAECGRQFFISVYLDRDKSKKFKDRMLDCKKEISEGMDRIEALVRYDKEDGGRFYKKFKKSWRPRMEAVETRVCNFLFPMADATTEEREITFADAGTGMQISKFSSQGLDYVEEMTHEALAKEERALTRLKKDELIIAPLFISTICLNFGVMVALLIYALRTYPKRLKEIADNAAKYSRKHGEGARAESDDALSDLDSVITELAEALSEAEKREQSLLQKLDESKNLQP